MRITQESQERLVLTTRGGTQWVIGTVFLVLALTGAVAVAFTTSERAVAIMILLFGGGAGLWMRVAGGEETILESQGDKITIRRCTFLACHEDTCLRPEIRHADLLPIRGVKVPTTFWPVLLLTDNTVLHLRRNAMSRRNAGETVRFTNRWLGLHDPDDPLASTVESRHP